MLLDLLRRRYSCRNFSDKKISNDIIQYMLECGRLSASGGNDQPLIFNGSTKIYGDTVSLIDEFASRLKGEIKSISFQNNISPCVDCRYCWKNIGCAIKDEMQDIYEHIKTCDNIVIASPIWFSSISGPLLNLASRVQSLFAAGYFQKKQILLKEKKGVIIIVGAQPETIDIPTQTVLAIMRYLNVHRPSVQKIYSVDTNNLPACEDKAALEQCRKVADLLNSN